MRRIASARPAAGVVRRAWPASELSASAPFQLQQRRAFSAEGIPQPDKKWFVLRMYACRSRCVIPTRTPRWQPSCRRYMLGVEIAGQMGDLPKDITASNGARVSGSQLDVCGLNNTKACVHWHNHIYWCICVCVHPYMYIFDTTHAHTQTRTHTHTHAHTSTHTHTHTQTYVPTSRFINIKKNCPYVHHVYVPICISMFIYVRIYTRIYVGKCVNIIDR